MKSVFSFARTALWIGAALVVAGPACAQDAAAPVAVDTIILSDVALKQTFVGTVTPARTSVVSSAVEGRVIEFFVKRGDRVEEGHLLAQLRTTTLDIELAAARAELALREHELSELENGSRPEEIAQAQARRRSAEALSQYAEAKLRRVQRLFEQHGTISKEELDETTSQSVAAQQALQAAKAAHELAEKGPRAETIKQARARLAMQQEEVNRVEDQISECTIRSPFDGSVVAEHTEVGQWLSRGDPVAEVIQLDPIEITVQVPEDHVSRLNLGGSALMTVAAASEKPIEAQIVRIVPQADVRTRTFPVVVGLANPVLGEGHLLKSGMLARVRLTIGRPEPALLVSKDALVLGGKTPAVFVFRPDATDPTLGTVEHVPVETGVAVGGLIQVTGDSIEKGLSVVIEGNERLRPGQTVRVIKSK